LIAIAAIVGEAMASIPKTTNATPQTIDQPEACRIRPAGESVEIATVPPRFETSIVWCWLQGQGL
jgi:hypothetical protein